MTATRKWTFGAVALALVFLVSGWFLLVAPKRADVAALQAQADAVVAGNAQKQTDLEVLKQQNKDLPEKQAELAALQTKIPTQADLPSYIREIQSIGDKAGVMLSAMSPAAPLTLGAGAGTTAVGGTTTVLTPDSLAAINVDLTIKGPYAAIQKFMNDLESADRYTLTTGLTIAEDDEATDAAASSGGTSGSSDLTGTVNARIFFMPEVQAVPTPTPTTAP
jgi:Tfp pilus assembly protein PilO